MGHQLPHRAQPDPLATDAGLTANTRTRAAAAEHHAPTPPQHPSNRYLDAPQHPAIGQRHRLPDRSSATTAPPETNRWIEAKGHERLDDRGEAKLLGLLEAGDPRGEVRLAWHAN
jgi:hypothetical protein